MQDTFASKIIDDSDQAGDREIGLQAEKTIHALAQAHAHEEQAAEQGAY